MDAMKSTIAAAVWLATSVTFAQAHEPDGRDAGADSSGSALHSDSVDALAALVAPVDSRENHVPPVSLAEIRHPRMGDQYSRYLKSYRLTSIGGITTSVGLHPLPTQVLSSEFIQERTGINTHASLSAERWLAQRGGFAQTFAVGHDWRDLTLEGATFSSPEERRQDGSREFRKIDSRSARLSFSPVDNWVVRLSRGTVSGLDHLVVGEQVRRTALSATYRRAFADADWEATLAWGRNSRKFRESTMGYLAESAFRFNGIHSLFGRFEQVGSDELVRENESLQRQLFMMNKLTLGYAQDLRLTSSMRVDVGAYVTRYFVPSGMAPSYGAGPTTYMMFARVQLR